MTKTTGDLRLGGVNLTHLRAFYVVAVNRSVSLAARRLGISQPTLSKQLKALEERYHVKLVDRDRTPLALTTIGEALFEKARAIFETSREVDALLGDDGIETGIVIRLGTDSPPFAAEFISNFTRRSPGSLFQVSIANAQETNHLLMRGQLDLAIVCEPPIHPDYLYEPLYVDELVAVVPAGSPLATARSVTFADLSREVLLMRERTSRTRSMMGRMMDEEGVVPRRVMELHTREMLREGVALGLGVTVMFRRECPPDERIATLPLDAPSALLTAHGCLVLQTERRRTPLMRKAVEVAKEMAARALPRDG